MEFITKSPNAQKCLYKSNNITTTINKQLVTYEVMFKTALPTARRYDHWLPGNLNSPGTFRSDFVYTFIK